MKNILFLFFLLFSFVLKSQTINNRQVPFHVSDSTTLFNASLIDGTIVFDEETNNLWRLNELGTGSNSLSTTLKTLINYVEDLEATLSSGNETNGNNILITDTDTIIFNTKAKLYHSGINRMIFDNGGDLFSFEGNGKYQFINNNTSMGLGESPDNIHRMRITTDGSIFSTALRLDVSTFGGTNNGLQIRSNTPKTSIGTTFGVNSILSGSTIAGHDYVAGRFVASGTLGNNYGIQVIDGTEGTIGHVLVSSTTDGKANWADVSTIVPAQQNLYTNDGLLSGNRFVNLGANNLSLGSNLIMEGISGFNGINTTTPSTLLDIKGVDNTSIAFHVGGFNPSPIREVNITSAGQLLLGTNTPLSSNRLDIVYTLNSAARINIENLNSGSSASSAMQLVANGNIGTFTVNSTGKLNDPDAAILATNGGNLIFNAGGSGDDMYFRTQNDNHISILNTGLVTINPDNLGADLNVKGLTNDNLLYIDVSEDVVGIGVGTGASNQSAILDVSSTTKGFLPPRMTTGQRNSIINPAGGLIIYNTTTNRMQHFRTNTNTWRNM